MKLKAHHTLEETYRRRERVKRVARALVARDEIQGEHGPQTIVRAVPLEERPADHQGAVSASVRLSRTASDTAREVVAALGGNDAASESLLWDLLAALFPLKSASDPRAPFLRVWEDAHREQQRETKRMRRDAIEALAALQALQQNSVFDTRANRLAFLDDVVPYNVARDLFLRRSSEGAQEEQWRELAAQRSRWFSHAIKVLAPMAQLTGRVGRPRKPLYQRALETVRVLRDMPLDRAMLYELVERSRQDWVGCCPVPRLRTQSRAWKRGAQRMLEDAEKLKQGVMFRLFVEERAEVRENRH